MSLAPAADPDLFWHLRLGEWILDNRALPTHDEWSLVADGARWVTHEWLGEVLYAASYRLGGFAGVAVLTAVAVSAVLLSVGVQALRRTTAWRAAALVTLAALGTHQGWGERPQLFSFLILVWVAPYIRSMTRGETSGWWLPLVVWVWANIHGYWVIALVLLGARGLGVLLDQGRRGVRLFAHLALVGVASLAAAALTPSGPRLLLAPLAVNEVGAYIAEYSAPSIRRTFGLALVVLVGLALLTLVRRRRGISWTVVLDIALATYLGLLYVRTTALGVLLLVTLLVELWTVEPSRRVSRAWVRGAAVASGSALVLLCALAAPARDAVEESYPAGIAAYLDTLPAGTGVLNEYGIGGYLLWAAPEVRPAVDGRTEIYEVDYVTQYKQAQVLAGDWRGLVRDVPADLALVNVDSPWYVGLTDGLGWTLVEADGSWRLLARP